MNDNKKKGPGGGRTLIIYLVLFAVVILVFAAYRGSGLTNDAAIKEVEYSEFVGYLQNRQITKIVVNESSQRYQATLKDGSQVLCYAPTVYDMMLVSQEYLLPQTADGTLTIDSIRPSIWAGLLSWLPTIALFVFMIFMWRQMMGGMGGNRGVMNFGKSRAQMTKDGDKKITFADVAGLEEEKQELQEIVDFLKNPKKYMELGARIPKGVLLVGPPGTGKTYISKAVAGEAGVPFFSISGSDFVEMFVGVGASRVRDLFDEAKKNAPCIVFIDEIDAVGRRRGAGIGGGNDEREQTLNQLLVEMDGFGQNEGIIILAATNRPDVLDPAILRPGRFDREVTISTPDVKGRQAVFELYAKNKPIDKAVDLSILAKRTPGFTPADIENMMNEAALLTARRNGTIIHMDDLEEAITRVIAGPKKRSRVMSEEERRLTAYHEGGHAVVARCIPGFDPVHQVTIMPRGRAGGFTLNLPEEDSYYATKKKMMEEIMDLLGGRVAESVVLGDISTGASNDLERATKLAQDMVTKYGMTEAVGPVNYANADEVFLGQDYTTKRNYSEELASAIDKEVRRIIDEAYTATEELIIAHRAELDRVAEALLELETLDADQFEAVFTGAKTIEDLKNDEIALNKERKAKEEQEALERARREAEEKARLEKELEPAPKGARRMVVFDANGKPMFKDTGAAEEKAEEKSSEAQEQEAQETEVPAQEAPNAEAPADEEDTEAPEGSKDSEDK
jgi:cell division protease FtsH